MESTSAWRDDLVSTYRDSYLPAGTQLPEDVPLWSWFGREVPDHNRTKIGRFRFLTYFSSTMYGMHLALGNIQKFKKPILWKIFKLTSWGRPKDVTLHLSIWDVFRTFIGRFSKTERIYKLTFYYLIHIWWTKTENITREMRFVLMFKIDVLGTS